jgi:hypothetical protein
MPKFFQISDGDAGFTYEGVNYTFSDVDSIDYTFNRKNRLTRGANGQNKVGLVYKEGLKTADVAEFRITDCSIDIYNLLLTIFNESKRINAWFIDRTTGEGFTFKNAIVRDKPRQMSIGESAESLSFMFAVESFDVTEKLNDA